ncbi:hypothetical protein [Niveispirillum fermenti]|uniref:hypothetical protein n=1 Tax=Niveispirillum fermenti TaxID=1233113 RepID=UPI003A89064A
MLVLRRCAIELIAGIAYAGMLLGTNHAVKSGMVPDAWLVPTALLPMLPCVAILWAITRHIRRMDEFQRRLQFEAIAFSFAATAMLTFSYGFLEGAGLPKLSMFVIWPLMAGLWVIGQGVARYRYR